MANTYLTVPFSEKDSAKALGARWDGQARQWYVPTGLPLAPFGQWLGVAQDASTFLDLALATPTELLAHPRGVSLSKLLSGVAKLVSDEYSSGVWTTAEVLRVHVKDGHVYLELTERDAEGRVMAKAQAAIWARTAAKILPEFERATGAHLAAGIKLLVLARPVFKAQHGFSLEITAIDPSYTLGDLEAQKREIRERLKHEGVFDRNRRLPAPWDFSLVLVVAPENAAGLGDFTKEADRLQQQGVCRFLYVHSRFQGPGAQGEILAALQRGVGESYGQSLDAVIIIRGGGAVNDLAWLNNYELARFVCMCAVPVLTGIGHERDSTVLDEVANQCFDTPSKVVAGIEKRVAERAREAKEAYNQVVVDAARAVERFRAKTERLNTEISVAARDTISEARTSCEQGLHALRLDSLRQVHAAITAARELAREVQSAAQQHIQLARISVPAAMATVRSLSLSGLRAARVQFEAALPAVLDMVSSHLRRAGQTVDQTMSTLMERAQTTVATATSRTDALMREIAGQGPEKTLSRGFAVVHSEAGQTVTSARAARRAENIIVSFSDGQVHAQVRTASSPAAQETPGEKT